jgi:hypothetical protein
MKIPMGERRVLIKAEAEAYRRSGKKEKTVILDRFVESTGYNRVHAARVLRNHGRGIALGGGVVVKGNATGRFRRGPET